VFINPSKKKTQQKLHTLKQLKKPLRVLQIAQTHKTFEVLLKRTWFNNPNKISKTERNPQ